MFVLGQVKLLPKKCYIVLICVEPDSCTGSMENAKTAAYQNGWSVYSGRKWCTDAEGYHLVKENYSMLGSGDLHFHFTVKVAFPVPVEASIAFASSFPEKDISRPPLLFVRGRSSPAKRNKMQISI